MRLPIMVLIVVVAMLAAAIADAQGYYERVVRRNPLTGRLEVVDASGGFHRFNGPNRNYRGFYGGNYDPYSGNAVQSRVHRNPVTGRLQVDNHFHNQYTGAQVTSVTRYNPFTQRYETVEVAQPPYRPLPVDPAAEVTAKEPRQPERPRIIETFPQNAPIVEPPPPPAPPVESQGPSGF